MERRLAAILAADVVGYSRLVEQDEAGTLAALKQRRREILQPLVNEYRGRVVKIMGDGVLVEFASAVHAVACAIELHKRMAAANAQLPQDRAIVLRIGVNLGDVAVDGGDLFGEGVNVAARLEAVAQPGEICLSGKVRDEVLGKLDIVLEDLGAAALKNMVKPVHVYRISRHALPDGAEASTSAAVLPLPAKPSIAVLPFTNMSGDPDQQYFSDGITEDIITELTRFRQLFVIARNSSFAFREKPNDVTEIGRRLGVQYVVEGSVRRAGGHIRITAQLIDSTTGNHIWAERYDRVAEDVFAVQDEVTQSIAAALFGRVEDSGAKRAKRKRPESLAAYEYLLRGVYHQQRGTRADLAQARPFLLKAIEIDPELAAAHAYLALVDQGEWDYLGGDALIQSALEHAQKAVELDEDDARCHVVLGYVCLWLNQLDRAEFHQRRALALNPNDAHIAAHMGLVEAYLGNPADGISWLEKALRLNPLPPYWYRSFLAMAHYAAREYGQVVIALSASSNRFPWDLMYLAASYAQLNCIEEARQTLSEWRALRQHGSLLAYAKSEPFKNSAHLDHLLEGLRKAGL
jgi:TolB-like protein